MYYVLGIKEEVKHKLFVKRYSLYANSGFTLVELLIVVVLIGILAAMVIVFINPVAQFQKARDAQRKSDLSQIQKVLEAYYDDNGKYPPTSGSGIVLPCAGAWRINPPTGCIEWDSVWSAYNTTIPKDPLLPGTYAYWASSDGQTYRLYTSLERSSADPQACSGTQCTFVFTSFGLSGQTTACGGSLNRCKYGVTSPNTSP